MPVPYRLSGSFPRRGRQKPTPSGKDMWDKVSTLTPAIITLILGLLGWYATDSYNANSLAQQKAQAENTLQLQQSQAAAALAQQKAQADASNLLAQTQALDKLFDYIASSDPAKRLFGYTMYAHLGNEELAAKLILLKQDQAGVPLLRVLKNDPNQAVSAAAKQGLDRLENVDHVGGSFLSDRASCKNFATMGFKIGKRQPPSEEDVASAAATLGVEVNVLKAVMAVMAGSAQLPDGRVRILFERHIFSRLTTGEFDKDHPDISSPSPGGYQGGSAEYERLQAAAMLNCPAALEATSWGAFQIMGLNYSAAGYQHPDDFITDVLTSGAKELSAVVAFLQRSNMVEPMKDKDWRRFALVWTGPAQVDLYSSKLKAKYDELSAP